MEIKSTAEISMESLNDIISQGHIFDIIIKDPQNYPVGKAYDIFALLSIKRLTNEFLKGCPLRKGTNPNIEKEIFAYIYVKLAYMVEYDDLAKKVSETNGLFRAYASDYLGDAAGLEGVWLTKSALCSGFAEALRNLLAEKGIEAKVISGWTKDEDGSFIGHSWNQVKLDGEWFNCDITKDRRFILNSGLAVPYFLKSNYEFTNYTRFSRETKPRIEGATRSVPEDEQQRLVEKYREIVLDEKKAKEEAVKTTRKKKNFFATISDKLKKLRSSQRGDS